MVEEELNSEDKAFYFLRYEILKIQGSRLLFTTFYGIKEFS